MNGVKYKVNSTNRKLTGNQKVDATYVAINVTCPLSCELREKGCYCQLGPLGIHVNRLNREAECSSPIQVARAEADAIDNSYAGGPVPNGRYMRLHVSGDSRTIRGTRVINAAVGRWKERGGGAVWSYTHCWDYVLAEEWSNVSMLASIDKVEDAVLARQNGYAPSLVVAEHPSHKVYTLPGSDVKWIPCPVQTMNKGCVDCKLCAKADWLYETNHGIAFSAHGSRQNMIKRRLQVVK